MQTKMRREIEEVVGSGRFPTMADKANLPYCEAVALEIQRRGNVAAQGLPRGVKYDGLFGCYFALLIARKTQCFILKLST